MAQEPGLQEAPTQSREALALEKNRSLELLGKLQNQFQELSHRRIEIYEDSIFKRIKSSKTTEQLIQEFQELRTKLEELLNDSSGEQEDITAIQATLFKVALKSLMEISAIEAFHRIHVEDNLNLWDIQEAQDKWNFKIKLSSFYKIFHDLADVPSETYMGFSPRSYNKDPILNISMNSQAYYKLALEALSARVNERTYLESFRCIMGFRQIELIQKFATYTGQRLNRVAADTGRFCLGLARISHNRLFIDPTEEQIVGDKIALDYSQDESAIRSILAKNFNSPGSNLSTEVQQALREYVLPDPQNPERLVPIQSLFNQIALFPETFNGRFDSSRPNTMTSAQFANFSRDIEHSLQNFLNEVPKELFNIFSSDPVAKHLSEVLAETEVILGTRESSPGLISDKLHKAEALFFYSHLVNNISSHPLQLSLLTFGDLDSVRGEILKTLILKSLLESKSEAFIFVFQNWLGDSMWSDEVLPLLQNLIHVAVDEILERTQQPQNPRVLHQWIESTLRNFQSDYQIFKKEGFNNFIKDLLAPAQDLYSLKQQPLEKLNLIYNTGTQAFSIRTLMGVYDPYLSISERVKDWMNVVFEQSDFDEQRSKIKEAMDLLKERAPKTEEVNWRDKVAKAWSTLPFTQARVESVPSFANDSDKRDYTTLLKLYHWLGYSQSFPAIHIEAVLPILRQDLKEPQIQIILENFQRELSYIYLSNPEHRLLDFDITVGQDSKQKDSKQKETKGQETKPLYEWLNPYNNIDSLGSEGIEWLRKVMGQINEKLTTTLKEINTKSLDEMGSILLYAQTFELELGERPVLTQRLETARDLSWNMDLSQNLQTSYELNKLSLLDFHRKVKENIRHKHKRTEELYDEYYGKFHRQFMVVLGVWAAKLLIGKKLPGSLSHKVISHFTVTNRPLLNGYWGLFTLTAAADLYYRKTSRQTSIDSERKHFEVLTYADMIPVNQYHNLLEHLDVQQDIHDQAIFTDYFLLAFPIVMFAGTRIYQRFFASNAIKMKEHRLNQGGPEFARRNREELQYAHQQFKQDYFANIDNFQAVGIRFGKMDDALASIQKLWDPSFLKQNLRQLEQANIPIGEANLAYRRVIIHIYERLSKFESTPTLFSRYSELYLGKKAPEVYKLIKEEYALITGVRL